MKKYFRTICLVIISVMLISAMLTSCSGKTTSPQVKENEENKKTAFEVTNDRDENSNSDEGKLFNVLSMSWPDRSLEEIVDGADYIVRAKNVGHEPSYRDEEGADRHIYTDYIFEILESFKGDRVVGDTVTVKWYGGELDGEKSVVAGETPINEGQEYILILSHETDENDKLTENDRYVYYPPRGILADDGTGVFTANDPAISFTADEFRAEVERMLG